MATQEQLDDLFDKSVALSTAKRGVGAAAIASNQATQIVISANALKSALEEVGATDHIQDLLTWTLEWTAESATLQTAWNAAYQVQNSAQGAYDTALNAILNP